MTIGFLVTARLKSKRLPRKVILEFAGKPMISHMIDRIKKARQIDKIVICTSTHSQDDPLEKIAQEEEVFCYRGSEADVLVRLYEAALMYHIDYIVNITADCPLIDPFFIDKIVETYKTTNADLIVSDNLPMGQRPNGIKLEALKQICSIKDEKETEVWRDYFMQAEGVDIHQLEVESDYYHSTLKTSLDYPEDYQFIKAVFSELYASGKIFSLSEILALVQDKPELVSINAHCAQLCVEHTKKTATPITLK